MQLPKTVLCAVDLTDLAGREVDAAREICEASGARLVLHHNVAAVSPALTPAWQWKEIHRDSQAAAGDVDRRLRELMRRLPRTFPVEASITSGSLVPIVLELATRIAADLIVLGSHGSSTDDHTSVAERILGRSSSPVLVIQEGVVSATPLRLRSRPGHAAPEVAVAIDFSNAGSRVLEYALGLARAFGLYLRVLHVEGALVSRRSTAETERRLAEIVPADLAGRVECHVELGDPAERIMNFLRERLPAYAVMGEHARDFVRRFFTRDTARQVLHRAPCPVWFVPPR